MLVIAPQASPRMHSRMDPRLSGPPNHRSESLSYGLTNCLIVLGDPSRPAPVTWVDQGEDTLVNMYQDTWEFPEISAAAGNWLFHLKPRKDHCGLVSPYRGCAYEGLGPPDCPWQRWEGNGYLRSVLVIVQWGSVPISLTHRAGCHPSRTHSAIPNLITPMAIKVTVYQ